MSIKDSTDLTGGAPPLADSKPHAGWQRSRRQLLAAGTAMAAAQGGLTRGAQAQAQKYDPTATWLSPEGRLARRITYGITPAELQRARALGFNGYSDYQLNYNPIDDSAVENFIGQAFPLVNTPLDQLQSFGSRSLTDLRAAILVRAVRSQRQLYQRMVEFWANHFYIAAADKIINDAGLMVADYRSVIRPHALGKFPDMLRASAHSAAMLAYLDNDTNTAPRPNQNYARELMELHTLGANGGYTQQDVAEVARCFTGWNFYRYGPRESYGQFRYIPANHDDGQKVVLGQIIPAGGGQQDGDKVLDILASHPNTAAFVSKKMVRWLLDYEPSDALVNAVAQVYLTTGGDIPSMVRAILTQDNLMAASAKFKRPLHAFASILRSTQANPRDNIYWTYWSGYDAYLVGHRPYDWPTPDGFPDKISFWTGSMLGVWNWANNLITSNPASTGIDIGRYLRAGSAQAVADLVDQDFLGGEMPADDKNDLINALQPDPPNDTRIREALTLIISSPNFAWY